MDEFLNEYRLDYIKHIEVAPDPMSDNNITYTGYILVNLRTEDKLVHTSGSFWTACSAHGGVTLRTIRGRGDDELLKACRELTSELTELLTMHANDWSNHEISDSMKVLGFKFQHKKISKRMDRFTDNLMAPE